MDIPSTNDLNSVIFRVRKLQFTPPLYVHTITSNSTGISAADVDQHSLNLAFSPGHSRDIYITQKGDSDVDLSGNFIDAWTRYKAKKSSKSSKAKGSQGSSLLLSFPHGAVVTGLQFTPDGNFLLSCGMDGNVKAWGTSSLQLLESYHGISKMFSDIHVSSDCKYFATSFRMSGQFQGNLFDAALYCFEKKDPVLTFGGHIDDTECVRFHPNGLYIATASGKTVKLWCTRSGKELRNFQVRDHCDFHALKLAFSPDGKYLATAYYESVKIWDLASNKVCKSFEIPNSVPGFINLCYNMSGNLLATGGMNETLHLWNAKSNISESSDMILENELLERDSIGRTVYCIKNTSSFFTCAVA